MSYVVNIWEQPARLSMPDKAETIWRMLDVLHRQVPGQNPKFLALARQLMAVFPEEQDEDGEGSVWLEGVADGRTDKAVWKLGLYSGERLDEVQAVLAARATALGLNVADEQAGDIYLAGGRILSQRPGAHCMPAFAAYFSGDHAAAWQAFLVLAGQGNLVAVRNLALMMLRGESARKNFGLAYALLVLAGEHEEAKRLGARLKPESLVAAEALVLKLKQPGKLVARVQQILATPATPARQQTPPLAVSPAPAAPGSETSLVLVDATAVAGGTAVLAASEPDEAVKKLMRRASLGDKNAQSDLAGRYKTGEGLEKNEATAAHWWALAAAQGLAEAQYKLAVACFFGEGVTKDQTKAFKLYCQAADQGHANAIYNLGVMHMQGIATPRDVIAGKALYVYAKSMGSEQASMPTFELGEASRALMLATLMGQSGKVLDTLVDWQRNKAEAAAGERDLESDYAGTGMAEAKAARARALAAGKSNAASLSRSGWHLGHLALVTGSLSMGLALLLPIEGEPILFMLLLALLMLSGAYGVWRSARDFGFSHRTRVLLVLLALPPVIGMFVCIGMLVKVLRRRLA
ncbi:MAG: hypothetical protein V4772_17690 [Pseudomonadota bacterium]